MGFYQTTIQNQVWQENGSCQGWNSVGQPEDPNDSVMEFAAKMNSNFSQLRELIPRGQIVNIPATTAD